jgi:RNA polymerase-binding transcription factor
LEQLEEQLADVDKALERMEEGTYGICTNCGKAILPERLEALPYAELCIDCQRAA